MGPDRRHFSLWRALAVLLVLAAVGATPAMADPGRPGVGNAAQGSFQPPFVAGETVGGEDPSGAAVPEETLGGAGGEGGSLPFTGLPAALLLGVGVGALLLGGVARWHTRS